MPEFFIPGQQVKMTPGLIEWISQNAGAKIHHNYNGEVDEDGRVCIEFGGLTSIGIWVPADLVEVC